MRQSAASGSPESRLVENLMHFARTLRAAGLPIGPGRVLDAIRAVEAVGITNREDFYWTLHAVFVNRQDQKELFDQAFHVFWRNPRLLERMLAMMLPQLRGAQPEAEQELSRRLAEALKPERGPDQSRDEDGRDEVELDAVMTYSDREILQHMDFEKMSGAEFE